jgi:hypothetical protein
MPNLVVRQRVVSTDESVHQRHPPPSATGAWCRKHNSDLWEIHV